MREIIVGILEEIRPDIDYDSELCMVDEGVLESFDIISIIAEIDNRLGIEIKSKDITAENFNSLDAMIALVEKSR